jgi:hypothetical protein
MNIIISALNDKLAHSYERSRTATPRCGGLLKL